jgi:hypothetical protein
MVKPFEGFGHNMKSKFSHLRFFKRVYIGPQSIGKVLDFDAHYIVMGHCRVG